MKKLIMLSLFGCCISFAGVSQPVKENIAVGNYLNNRPPAGTKALYGITLG